MFAAVAALIALPAVAETVVQKQVTTQTVVDCTTILGDTERLACYQRQSAGLPAAGIPVVTREQQTVRDSDGNVRSVETTRTLAPAPVVPLVPVVPETRTVTTTEAPVAYSKTTTTTRTVD
jgi:hypothetical protein